MFPLVFFQNSELSVKVSETTDTINITVILNDKYDYDTEQNHVHAYTITIKVDLNFTLYNDGEPNIRPFHILLSLTLLPTWTPRLTLFYSSQVSSNSKTFNTFISCNL